MSHKPIDNRKIYPRPFPAAKEQPDGYCCAAFEGAVRAQLVIWAPMYGVYAMPLAGSLSIPGCNGNMLIPSFCPFCGFKWLSLSPSNEIYVDRKLEERTDAATPAQQTAELAPPPAPPASPPAATSGWERDHGGELPQ